LILGEKRSEEDGRMGLNRFNGEATKTGRCLLGEDEVWNSLKLSKKNKGGEKNR